MEKNLYTDDISLILMDKSLNQDTYETTYKSSYGRFYPEDNNKSFNNINYYQRYTTNILTNKINKNYHKNTNLEKFLKSSQEQKSPKNPKLVCPNCINENILKAKSMNKVKKEQINPTEYFEDKMKSIHEKKKKEDIQNRENRTKNTYLSLFRNRNRSAQLYKTILGKEKKGEFFGGNVDYGMLRCRNRELNNDKRLFGLYLLDKTDKNNKNETKETNNIKTNKSWLGQKNYLLDKNEYSFIINKQIEKADFRTKKERYKKLKEENHIINSQINKEKNDINKEICNKNKKRKEINKINSNLLKARKIKEYKKKLHQIKEKEIISQICKKQLDEMIRKFRQNKFQNMKIDNENKKISENKQLQNIKEKLLMRRNNEGLKFTEVEKKSCEKCNRLYPKNVLSYMYYTYNDQQKDNDQTKL